MKTMFIEFLFRTSPTCLVSSLNNTLTKPNGMNVAPQENLYCTGSTGVWLTSPDGRDFDTIINRSQQPGTYNCELSTDNYRLTGEVYFYTLSAGNLSQTRKMIVMK